MQEKIKLSEWAEANGKTYKQAYNLIEKGEFPDKFEKNKKTGTISVYSESKASAPKQVIFATPLFAQKDREESTASRRNRAGTIDPTNEYYHIENGIDPLISSGRSGKNNDSISATEAIRLCQKAYYNFSEFSNVMNVMCEFSTSPIYFQGGNKKSRDFFTALFNKLNIQSLQEKFFLEYYRSGNVFPYRLEAVINDDDLNNINKVYGANAAKKIKLPVKYIIINPASITCAGSISFSNSRFYQTLNAYEIQRLKKPITEEDTNFYNSLPPDIQKQIKEGSNQILLPLDPQYVYTIFWKKMDYEPLSIPMGWSVLRDLNWKIEMKKIDMAVARTTQRAVLLITMGFQDKDGNYIFDAKAAEAMRSLFESESVGKTLVGDFTTKGEWLIPDVDKLLGPEKYVQVNQDIQAGLNNVLAGSNEKFANQSIKVKLFIQRLTQSREAFLNEFIKPEIKRLSKILGFKSYPTPIFETIDLKDEDLFARILAQLAGIGYLTPEEVFSAMDSGRLPTGDESEESQRKFKKFKDEGLYQTPQLNPKSQLEVLSEQGKQQLKMQSQQLEHEDKQKTKELKHQKENPVAPAPSIHINAPTKMGQPTGRPTGTGTPKTQKKPAKPSKAAISAALIKENLILASDLNKQLESQLLKKFKLKKLNESQIQLKDTLLEQVMLSESSSQWVNPKIIEEYINNPDKKNEERFNYCINLGQEHQVNDYLAGIIANSQIEIKEEIENAEDPDNI